jgi:hypothetical protein
MHRAATGRFGLGEARVGGTSNTCHNIGIPVRIVLLLLSLAPK